LAATVTSIDSPRAWTSNVEDATMTSNMVGIMSRVARVMGHQVSNITSTVTYNDTLREGWAGSGSFTPPSCSSFMI